MIQLKRAYEAAESSDGYRVLVDRIWPRGLTKNAAKIDLWLKEIGPSKEFWQEFHHEQVSFAEFTDRYKEELKQNAAFEKLREISQEYPIVTLVFASKNVTENQAVVLKTLLEKPEFS